MPVRTAITVMLLAFAFGTFSAETTQSQLAKYGEQLADTWKVYPTEKDALARKQKMLDLTTAFTQDLKTLDAADNVTIKKALDDYRDNLLKSKTMFRQDKMNEERTSFAAASGNVCKRELLQSTDAAAERPAHKCFDLLADWAEESKSSLRLATEEMHTAYYSMLNEAFVLLMKSASKDEGDPTAIYDKELKEIRKRFPVTAPAMQKINQPFVTLLEGAAKKVSEFNRK